MQYEWDEQKCEINRNLHGTDFAEAHRIFLSPVLTALDDRFDYGEDRWVGLGLLDERIVYVVSLNQTIRHGVLFRCGRLYNMKESNLSSTSKTNWERFDALTDEEIDTSDSPPLSEEFFTKAKWLMPGEGLPHRRVVDTVKVELDLDPQILAWFQSQGEDYERRMLAALRLYAEVHQASAQ